MHEDEPADLVHDVFTEALYPGHPLGREVLGDASTISAMSRDQIRGYFNEFYRPEAIVVALNTNHAQITHKIDSAYLAELSSDATPALLASRAGLDPSLRKQVTDAACAGPRDYSPPVAAFNWADAQAVAARQSGC